MIDVNHNSRFGRFIVWMYFTDAGVPNATIVFLVLGIIIADILGMIF